MKKRILGNDLEVSAISLGCMGLSHGNGKATEEQVAVTLLEEALDVGYTMFDTAETYGFPEDPHHNEKLLGKAFKGKRDQVILATKFGVSFAYGEDKSIHSGLILDSRPETIRKSVEGSLERLQTDYIDLYYQHRVDPNVPAEVVAETMQELIREGKIRHWGVSMADEDYIRKAHAICPITVSQDVYSLFSHDEQLFDTLEELRIGLVACCPIAKGATTGRYHKGQKFEQGDMRNNSRWFSEKSLDKYAALQNYLEVLAKEKSATVGQLSLAWILEQKDWIVPIPGTRKRERLVENAKAAEVHFTSEELNRIRTYLK